MKQIQKGKGKKTFWLKGLVGLFCLMFLFTIISRISDSITVPQVKVDSPSARKLQHIVYVEGRIEKNRELAVLTQPELLVKSVLVSEGQRVKKGDVLAKLDLVQLEDRIESINDEKRILELQNKAAGKNKEEDSSIEANNISIQNLKKQLDKLLKIKKQKGKILAPKEGVITGVLVNVGEHTTDSGFFTMTDDSAGLKFAGQMAVSDAKYVSVGDRILLQSAGQKREDISITSLEMDESREFMNITALLPADTFSMGETVTMTVSQESDNYPCTVPVTAIRQESGRNFILTVQTEETVLGKQEVARQVEVTVLEKNDSYAALEMETLNGDSQIIIDSDQQVKTGQRVRSVEEIES